MRIIHNKTMELLAWELAVLSRAVSYPNLSSASAHVGLSQPQLSRIVARLELELSLVLLDREARRKSGWTPVALRLAESCQRVEQGLRESLRQIAKAAEPRQLRIGTLEGLALHAAGLARHLFEATRVERIEVAVLDLTPLEERFLAGELELLLTFREPGRRKFRYRRQLGFQTLRPEEPARSAGPPVARVLSPYEFSQRPTEERLLVSNSLALRREWVRAGRGAGLLPSELRRGKGGAGDQPVYLIAHDYLGPRTWQKVLAFAPAAEESGDRRSGKGHVR
jgi:DNA-binding transcriptional LysR family regulator